MAQNINLYANSSSRSSGFAFQFSAILFYLSGRPAYAYPWQNLSHIMNSSFPITIFNLIFATAALRDEVIRHEVGKRWRIFEFLLSLLE